MILIDKSKDFQNIILTLTELTDGLSGDYVLALTSDSTRKQFNFLLPENTSSFQDRFDLFSISTDVFSELNEGFYSYQISFNGDIVEKGKAQVKGASNPSQNIIQPNSSSEILIYGE